MAKKPTYEELEQRVNRLEKESFEHKQVEETLRESELKYRTLFEYSEFLIYITDSKGNILLANSKGADFMGQSQETIVGKSFFGLRPDRAEMYQDVIDKILSTGETLQFETLYPTPGKDKWLFVTVSPLKIGNDTRLQIVTQDITPRKQTEETLRESEDSLNMAQKIASIGSWGWNIQQDTLSWSNQTYIHFGLKPGEVTPTYEAFEKFVYPDDRELVNTAVEKALKEDKPYSIEVRMTRVDGTEWIMHAQGIVYKDKKGNPVRFIGTQHDITERKHAEEALRGERRKISFSCWKHPRCELSMQMR